MTKSSPMMLLVCANDPVNRMDPPSDFIASAFQATEGHFGRASGIGKAKDTIIQEANLHRPANVTFKSVDAKSKQLSLEVTDFLGVRVRAVFDINGILITWKQM